MKWYKVLGDYNANEPFIKKIKAGGKNICLISNDGKLFALSATCPHAGGDLSRGWCKDAKLVCPIHRFSYDLNTGKGSEGQNDYIDAYPVEVRSDGVYIGIEGFWEKIKANWK
jgi:nitrite reductase/ring-hydroxylating ferredoxin subunit